MSFHRARLSLNTSTGWRPDRTGHRAASPDERRRGQRVALHHGRRRSFGELFRREPLRSQQGSGSLGERLCSLLLRFLYNGRFGPQTVYPAEDKDFFASTDVWRACIWNTILVCTSAIHDARKVEACEGTVELLCLSVSLLSLTVCVRVYRSFSW